MSTKELDDAGPSAKRSNSRSIRPKRRRRRSGAALTVFLSSMGMAITAVGRLHNLLSRAMMEDPSLVSTVVVGAPAVVESSAVVAAAHKLSTNGVEKRAVVNSKPHHTDDDDNNNTSGAVSTIETHQATAPYAYVFLLAGCNPAQPFYRGFLFNILLACERFRRDLNSQADVVVLVRMAASNQTTATAVPKRLPAHEEAWLRAVGAHVLYLPAAPPTRSDTASTATTSQASSSSHAEEGFSSLQMLKFHILRLVQYKRVLFMDSDVLPLCNLDYLFDLSMNGILRENLVIAWSKEPANGGFFLLEPSLDSYQQIQETIVRQRESAKHLAVGFDKIKGWGHEIDPDDPWYSFRRRLSGHKWSFYAAFSDQGLLYHYVKFLRRSVSIVLGKAVQNFRPGPNGTVVLDHELDDPFHNYTCRHNRRGEGRYMFHPATSNELAVLPPYGDFCHFYSVFKPWENPDEARAAAAMTNRNQAQNVLQYWFFLLGQLNERLHMGIPLQGDAWRDYSLPFRSSNALGGNRVPNLKQLAKMNRSIHTLQ